LLEIWGAGRIRDQPEQSPSEGIGFRSGPRLRKPYPGTALQPWIATSGRSTQESGCPRAPSPLRRRGSSSNSRLEPFSTSEYGAVGRNRSCVSYNILKIRERFFGIVRECRDNLFGKYHSGNHNRLQTAALRDSTPPESLSGKLSPG